MKSPVEASNTVPRQVKYVDRKVTDKIWAGIYVLFYIGFIVTGFTITSQARARFDIDENGVRTIGSAYLEDAQQCCDAHDGTSSGSICGYLEGGNSRHLQDGNESKFERDEGIFDAFLMAPEIMIVMFLFVLGLSATWIILLRFFAKPIIILIEICKVGIFTLLGVYSENWTFYIFAGLSAAYSFWSRNDLRFAAKVISYSAIAMKENPSIFIGALVTFLVYAGNAALYVYVFSKSFDVVEVKSSVESDDELTISYSFCEFESRKYVSSLMSYNSIAYLWTILLLDSIRLSIVSTIVGSWYFHPEDIPGIGIAMRNVLPSIGTMSLNSLIATVAEQIKEWIMGDVLQSCSPMCLIMSPFRIFACFCTEALDAFVNTYTRLGLIMHVFSGKTYLQSTKSSFKILSRHFKYGVVTEVSTKSVLYIESYVLSLCVAIISWAWIADRFDCENFSDLDSSVFILYLLMIVFVVYYPVLGQYALILLDLNSRLGESSNYIWIPPIAGCFVGCLSMMMFSYITSLFLDMPNTLFLCFCIDKDHHITDNDDELTALVQELPGYINADLILDPEEGQEANSRLEYDEVNRDSNRESTALN